MVSLVKIFMSLFRWSCAQESFLLAGSRLCRIAPINVAVTKCRAVHGFEIGARAADRRHKNAALRGVFQVVPPRHAFGAKALPPDAMSLSACFERRRCPVDRDIAAQQDLRRALVGGAGDLDFRIGLLAFDRGRQNAGRIFDIDLDFGGRAGQSRQALRAVHGRPYRA